MADGADQREIARIGAGEDQPAVAVLEHIDIVGLEQPPNHDLAELHRGGAAEQRLPQDGFRDRCGPGARSVGQRPRRDHAAMAAIDHREPPDVGAVGADAARAGADHGAALGRIDGIGDHQPRIVDHASEYSKAMPNGRFSALPIGWWVTSTVSDGGRAAAAPSRS